MRAAGDEVDIAFGGDFVSGAHGRIKILLIRVTDTYPSPSKSGGYERRDRVAGLAAQPAGIAGFVALLRPPQHTKYPGGLNCIRGAAAKYAGWQLKRAYGLIVDYLKPVTTTDSLRDRRSCSHHILGVSACKPGLVY